MIARDCVPLARYEEAPIHVQHLSARASVEEIARAKGAGVEVTCEASPHHLTLTDEAVRALDARFKMNPPLRTEDDRRALIDGLREGRSTASPPITRRIGRGEGGPLRGGGLGGDRAGDRLRRASHGPGPSGSAAARAAGGADDERRRALRDRAPRLEVGATANIPLIDPASPGASGRRLREPLLQQLLRRLGADRPRPDDGGGGGGRLPPAVLRDGGRRMRALSSWRQAERTALVVVDVQEGFRKAIPDFERVAQATATLDQGAEALGVPIVITEQYPKGLGETAPEVAGRCRRARIRSRRSASRRRRRRGSISPAGSRRSSAESRPTSA